VRFRGAVLGSPLLSSDLHLRLVGTYNSRMAHVGHLLQALEDPFEMFPMQSVAHELSRIVDRATEDRLDRNGPMAGYIPRSLYSVEDEHDIAVEQLLIGSAFVLGQAAISQAVSIATKINELAGRPTWLPHGKGELMRKEALVHDGTGLSTIALIDAVANYFKHHYEWPDNWEGAGRAQPTVDIVRKLGLEPDEEGNLPHAARELGMTGSDLSPISTLIQEWRERLAVYLRKQLDRHVL
jgi:hypothetical protein